MFRIDEDLEPYARIGREGQHKQAHLTRTAGLPNWSSGGRSNARAAPRGIKIEAAAAAELMAARRGVGAGVSARTDAATESNIAIEESLPGEPAKANEDPHFY
jgi:hypothetical protein